MSSLCEHPIKNIKVYRGNAAIPELSSGAVATIGNFDGVHLGHQMLLAHLRARADVLHLPVLVLLFEPQPSEYFYGEQAPARLYRLREKIRALQAHGVDVVYCFSFNQRLASLSPTAFAEQYLFSLLQVKYLLIGHDFRFGQGRVGDVTLLKQLGAAWHCTVETCSDYTIEQQRVSSTQIRHALVRGDLQQATALLGKPYTVSGRVVRGEGRGRQWGIPTANVNLAHVVLPLKGVFFVQVEREGQPVLSGVANLGTRPTLNGSKTSLEVHVLNMDESLYGERLRVIFLCKWRDEIKFASIDLLIAQIRQDIRDATLYFARSGVNSHDRLQRHPEFT